MTAGRWLDASTTAARQGLTALHERGLPAGDLAAVLYARDRAWHRLANLADLIRGTPPMPVTLADAREKLTQPFAQPIRILAAAARAAPIRAYGQPDYRPNATSQSARLLVAAADHIATLGDLLATHLRPRPAQKGPRLYPHRDPDPHHRAAHGQLTAAGRAISHGAEREQIVGELAQIARAWYAVDRTLADPGGLVAAHLPAGVASRLHTWLASPFGGLFDDYAATTPATGLRTLQAATDPNRPTGPRLITSTTDIRRTLNDITTTLTRDPQQATIRLAAAIARLGYVAHTRAVRAQPREPAAAEQLAGWKDLVHRLDQLRHLRDQHRPELADETNRAAAWLLRQPPPADSASAAADDLRPAISNTLRHTVTPLRRAVADQQILTATRGFTGAVHKGVQVAEQTWTATNAHDPATRAAIHQLADVAHQHRTASNDRAAEAAPAPPPQEPSTVRPDGSPRLLSPSRAEQQRRGAEHAGTEM